MMSSNQFLSGGFILMIGGFVLNWARSIPQLIKELFLRKFTTMIEVTNRDPLFWWTEQWLASHPYASRSGLLSASSRRTPDGDPSDDDDDTSPEPVPPRIDFSPAPGSHWLRYGGCWLHVSRAREDRNNPGQATLDFRETLQLRLFSRDRTAARKLFEEARDLAFPPEDRRIIIYGSRWSDWSQVAKVPPREPRSVILEDGILEDVLGDIVEFLGSASWYRDRCVPYHRGYLFHGEPGNGKTSLITAVATHVGFQIAILNLGREGLAEDTLRQLVASLPERTILVVEDVDRDLTPANETGQVATAHNKLSFSALLNMLDGIGTPEGRIIFMTTNHRDQLDPAMVRPGRIDREFELKNATPDQARRIFLRFFPGEAEFAEQFADRAGDREHSMAKLQGHLLLHRDCAHEAVNAAWDLATKDESNLPCEFVI
ncbi:BCS1 and AAA domain-containing protein [Singulisphaera sp. PoT]|uniref:BCS1 and AAA domain-containing protein n=1 Tax=Singulisphaera sp. PoT TaxID=3411797 RepID=UPI003BF48BE5